MTELTVIILAQNNENLIKRTLESIAGFCHVLVIDGGSTDRTEDICREFDLELVTNKFIGFSEQRNFALSLVKTKWILFLDSDEVLTESLKSYLDGFLKKDHSNNMFGIMRTEYLNNQEIVYGYGKSDYQTRLFRAGKVSYVGSVHESPIDSDSREIKMLPFDLRILHNPERDFDSIAVRLRSYAKLAAEAKISKGRKVSGVQIFLNMNWQFLRLAFRSRKDGYRGVLAAWCEAIVRTLTYLYIYEKNKIDKEDNSAI